MTCKFCGNPLKTGKTYCSKSCAAKARTQNTEAAGEFRSLILDKFGSKFGEIVDKISEIALEEADSAGARPQSFSGIPLPVMAKSREDFYVSFGNKEYRPEDKLDFETIRMMERSGPVMFALWMMISRILKVFTDGRYVIESPDEPLAEAATAAMAQVMPKMARDFLYSMLTRGVSFQEETWRLATKFELGLSNSRNATQFFSVPNVPRSLDPESIKHIDRTESRRYDGFTQTNPDGEDIRIGVRESLIIPYNSRFGNLWGNSFFEPIYPIWVWYEHSMRACGRYVDKEAKPVIVAYAPGNATVDLPGVDKPVEALDLALTLAASIAHSNAVAIPSDKDQSGSPLWELKALETRDRSAMFTSILEYLSTEMIRAALSADNSIAKSSGGVGSYNIGEVHWRASALAAESILIDALFYLNEYFIPGFSLYNRGVNGPPIRIRTQPLDQQDKELLMKLISVAGNSEPGQEFFSLIDWREMAEVSNIPTFSDEEIKARQEEKFKQGLDHQKKQMEMLAKVKQPSQPGQGADQDVKPPSTPGGAPDAESGQKKLELMLLNGNATAFSPSDLDKIGAIYKEEATGKHFFLAVPFDESLVKRDEGGKFAKKAAGASGAEEVISDLEAGLENLNPDQQAFVKELIDGIREQGELSPEDLAELQEFSDAMKLFEPMTFDDINQAKDHFINAMKDMGIEGLQNISEVRAFNDEELAEFGDRAMLVGGEYDPDTNTIKFNPAFIDKVKSGDHIAQEIMIHELLHSNQEVFRSPEEGEFTSVFIDGKENDMHGAILDSQDIKEVSPFVRFAEGQNELLTRMISSKLKGVSMTTPLLQKYALIRSAGASKDGAASYENEVTIYANVLQDVAEKRRVDPIDLLIQEHNHGMDMPRFRKFLAEADPIFNERFLNPVDYASYRIQKDQSWYEKLMKGYKTSEPDLIRRGSRYRARLISPEIRRGRPS